MDKCEGWAPGNRFKHHSGWVCQMGVLYIHHATAYSLVCAFCFFVFDEYGICSVGLALSIESYWSHTSNDLLQAAKPILNHSSSPWQPKVKHAVLVSLAKCFHNPGPEEVSIVTDQEVWHISAIARQRVGGRECQSQPRVVEYSGVRNEAIASNIGPDKLVVSINYCEEDYREEALIVVI